MCDFSHPTLACKLVFSLTSQAPWFFSLDILLSELCIACYFISFGPLLKSHLTGGPPTALAEKAPFPSFCTSLPPFFIFRDKHHHYVNLLFNYFLACFVFLSPSRYNFIEEGTLYFLLMYFSYSVRNNINTQ